ncbi:Alpha/Beta hydrolase protein [Umbelopsis sp. AD052]|nr:Alpha/Beta hydrolase protein [Umbelopsis sp. AD052]
MSSFLSKLRVSITLWIFWALLSIRNLHIARVIFNAVTKPTASQKPWMVTDPQEKTCVWVLEGAASLKQEELYDRIKKADVVLVWVHGGAMVFGSAAQNMEPFIKWIKLFKEKKSLNVVICGVEYRLAPENPVPAQFEDVATAYTHIVKDLGIPATKIILGGDSAGSLLGPEAVIYSREFNHLLPNNGYQLPIPAGYVLSSPVAEVLNPCPSMEENKSKDYNPPTMKYLGSYVNSGPSEFQPKPWVLFNDDYNLKANAPKSVLVFVGGHEIGRDENILIAKRFSDGGVDTTVITEQYPHNWFLLGPSVVDEPIVNEKADEKFVNWVIESIAKA